MLEEARDTGEIIERVAALDIGKAELVCCVRVPDADRPGRRLQEVTPHSTMTRSLLVMADRLRGLGVTRVVMEATSVYWKAPFYLLEAAGSDPLPDQPGRGAQRREAAGGEAARRRADQAQCRGQ